MTDLPIASGTSDIASVRSEAEPSPEPAAPRFAEPYPQEGIEARIDLFESHAFMKVAAVLQSFNEGFTHVYFDRVSGNTILSDEYENAKFHITYCLCEAQRDQLWVRWVQRNTRHGDAELLALARQIAHLLGGGTNLRLVDIAATQK